MFRPVGPESPTVYWRRRLILAGAVALLIVLLAVTINAVTSSGSGGQAGGPASTSGFAPGATTSSPTTATARTSTPRSTGATTSSPATTSRSGPSTSKKSGSGSASTSSAVPPTCRSADLAVAAVVGATSYQVGDKPLLELQVTNRGSGPCVQDLADPQIVLKVYNGESRVWGSHDCEIQQGTMKRTLSVGAPVRVSITWSGLTSQPSSCDHRQRVGAGTYTLYATLSGKTGTAAQFTIS